MFKWIINRVKLTAQSIVNDVAPTERVNGRGLAAYGLTLLCLAVGAAMCLPLGTLDRDVLRALAGIFLVLLCVTMYVALRARVTQRSPVKTMHLKVVLVVLYLLFVVPNAISSIPGVTPTLLMFMPLWLGFIPWVLAAAAGFLLVNLYRYVRLQPPLVSFTSKPSGAVGKWLLVAGLAVSLLSVLSLYLVVLGVGAIDLMIPAAQVLLMLAGLSVGWRLVTSDGMAHCFQAADRGVLLFWAKGMSFVWLSGLALLGVLGTELAGYSSMLLVVFMALTVFPVALIGFVKLFRSSIQVLFKGQSFFAGVADSGGRYGRG